MNNSMVDKSTKENYSITSSLWSTYTQIMNNELEKAKDSLEICQQKIESRHNQDEIKALNLMKGLYHFQKGNNQEAIDFFSKAYEFNPINWYYTAAAYKKIGDMQKASEFLRKIEDCNQNSLDLSFYRTKALAELGK
jgi:tetratricopeptide (TPR) repeat protein